MANPARLVQAQLGFWQDYLTLWQNTARRMMGERRAAGDRRGPARPPLQGRGVAGERGLRLHPPVLPALRPLLPERGRRRRRAGREDGAEGGFLHAPVRRRDEPVQLPADQPGGAAPHRRDGRREPAEGPVEPAGGPGARQGPAPHPHDGRHQVPGRREHRGHAGQGRVPERPDAADPVRADDGDGAEAAAADLPALDQQVLHPRPAPEELLRPLGGGAGPHRLRRLLGEPGRAARREGLRRLHAGRRLRRARRHREGDRREGR